MFFSSRPWRLFYRDGSFRCFLQICQVCGPPAGDESVILRSEKSCSVSWESCFQISVRLVFRRRSSSFCRNASPRSAKPLQRNRTSWPAIYGQVYKASAGMSEVELWVQAHPGYLRAQVPRMCRILAELWLKTGRADFPTLNP